MGKTDFPKPSGLASAKAVFPEQAQALGKSFHIFQEGIFLAGFVDHFHPEDRAGNRRLYKFWRIGDPVCDGKDLGSDLRRAAGRRSARMEALSAGIETAGEKQVVDLKAAFRQLPGLYYGWLYDMLPFR